MTCHGMRHGSLPPPKSSSSRTVTQHLPKNQSCALETPLRLRSSARGPSSTLLERHRVAPSDSQARGVSTQSALITAASQKWSRRTCRSRFQRFRLVTVVSFHFSAVSISRLRQRTMAVFRLRDIKMSSDSPQDGSHHDRIWTIPDYLGIQRSGSHQPRVLRNFVKGFSFLMSP